MTYRFTSLRSLPSLPVVAFMACVLLALAACQPIAPISPAAATSPAPVDGSVAGPSVAFVRDRTLYVQDDAPQGTPRAIASCAEPACRILYPEWSPDGRHLLYYIGSLDGSQPQTLRVVARTGQTQTVTDNAAYLRPGAWSPAGDAIAFQTDTGRYATGSDGPAQRILELWTVEVAEDGRLGTPELHGETLFGEGCGGGGRSESALAYEAEGGFAYGYLAPVFVWTPDQLLLYTDNCTNVGIGRYDLSANQPLEPYSVPLRSLALNAAGDAWVAIDDQGVMVTGTPSSLDVTQVDTAKRPELVFVGQSTGSLYYTTLEVTGSTDAVDQAAQLDAEVLLQPYFDFTAPGLYIVDPATGAERELHAGDAYAYARVVEQPDGSVYFARVEDNTELLSALQAGAITAANWPSYLPTVDVLRIPPSGGPAEVWLPDAAQFAMTEE